MKELFKKQLPILIGSLLFTIIHILIVKGRDQVTFHFADHSGIMVTFIIILAILWTFFFYMLIGNVALALYHKNETFLSYFKYFAGYFGFMSFFWLLCWPGIFKGDEFYVIKSALDFTMSGAQSGITSLFYMVALLFFPSMASIVFFQLLIICSIFAIVMHDLFIYFQPLGKKRFLLCLPFALLPVIDGNLFTLRATLVGWIFLFLFAKSFLLIKAKSISTWQLIYISILCGLVIAWRTEYVYLILFCPLLFFIKKLMNLKKCALFLILIVCFFQLFQLPNKAALYGSNKYPISLVLNPVGNLFKEAEDLKGPQVYDDIMTINELVDVALLRQTASVRNISQYWNIDDILPEEQLSAFMQASLRLIIYNPDKFLKYRWQTFAYTSGLYKDRINHPGGECISAINSLLYYDHDYRSFFLLGNPPLGQSLREKTISFLACRIYEQDNIKTTALLPIFYNLIPPLVLLLIMMVISVCKKRYDNVWLALLLLPSLVLIFLTAPAMFFMYYFCFYLCGYFYVMLSLLDLQNAKFDSQLL